METLRVNGRNVEVEEVGEDVALRCRVLKVVDGDEYFFEALVSTGPYKIDVPYVQRMSEEEVAAFKAGRIDMARLARELTGE
ncbi:MAG: hypothetical protein WBC44_12330 [Planctomycetaceae bacterium]